MNLQFKIFQITEDYEKRNTLCLTRNSFLSSNDKLQKEQKELATCLLLLFLLLFIDLASFLFSLDFLEAGLLFSLPFTPLAELELGLDGDSGRVMLAMFTRSDESSIFSELIKVISSSIYKETKEAQISCILSKALAYYQCFQTKVQTWTKLPPCFRIVTNI